MRKIIFLDIDGVMNCLNHRKEHPEDFGKMYEVDPEHVVILNDLVAKTGAEIVLSSTWRLDPNYKEVMQKYGINVIGRTCSHESRFRGEEIDIWLHEHDQEEIVYAIIDDDSDMYPHQPHFKTDGFNWGLTQEIADRVLLHLGLKWYNQSMKEKRKIKHFLALWHFFFGHPAEDCEDVAPLTKRCRCGAEFCLSDFYGW